MRRLLVPLGVLLFVDLLRVWLPSIITIFGQAASTPAELLGAFALMWFVLAFLAPVLARFAGAGQVGVVAALVLAGCRLALVVTAGQAQLYVASAGLLAGLCWLITLAMRGASSRPVGYGLVAAAVEHAAVGTFDLTWRGMWAAVPVGVLVAAFVVLVFVGGPEPLEPGPADGSWFVVGPVFFVALQVALSPALVGVGVSYVAGGDGVAVSAGPLAAAVEVVLVAAAVLAFGYLVARPPIRAATRVLCAVGVVTGAAAFGYAPGWAYVVVVPVTAAALGGCLGLAASGGARSARPGGTRPGFAAAGGMLVFAVAVFAYYASYDLGYPNGWVPPLVAAVVAAVALRRGAPVAPAVIDARLRWAVPVAVLALASSGVWWAPPETRPAPRPNELRLVAYNVRMGFGLDGRFSIDELARVVRAERPDVVLLSEVDRGWLLNGGHDDVRLLARELGLAYAFAPAADAVWGDAILTNLPVVSWLAERMPSYGAPTGGQVMGAVLRHGSGTVAVVSTHLQPPPGRPPLEQARDVARFATGLRAPGRPVIVGGDLNTEPGDPPFEALVAAGFTDAFAASRPVFTSSADKPRKQIDHVLVSGATATDVTAPRSTASDHLAVAVTLRW